MSLQVNIKNIKGITIFCTLNVKKSLLLHTRSLHSNALLSTNSEWFARECQRDFQNLYIFHQQRRGN